MLKKSASFVLASLRGSTYGSKYASASALAEASLGGLFEHPAGCSGAGTVLSEKLSNNTNRSFASALSTWYSVLH
jgi:hypothetical protein